MDGQNRRRNKTVTTFINGMIPSTIRTDQYTGKLTNRAMGLRNVTATLLGITSPKMTRIANVIKPKALADVAP